MSARRISAYATVVFLDIDGVIAVGGRYKPRAIASLNTLCTSIGAQLVISSAHRDRRGIRAELQRAGVTAPFHTAWRTQLVRDRPGGFGSRGGDIAAWHTSNPGHARYIILDDANDILPEQESHWIQPDESVGLTPADTAKAMTLLAEQPAP
jgi:hypothetical protein